MDMKIDELFAELNAEADRRDAELKAALEAAKTTEPKSE